jgi:diguanylate cyclase (GGDEF)-like protein
MSSVRAAVSLQSRIFGFFLALLLLVLGGTLYTVSRATYSHSLSRAQAELDYGRKIVLDKLAEREHALAESASALAKDDALRQAIFAGAADPQSMAVALENHRLRTRADLSVLVGLDRAVLVDTADRRREGRAFAFPDLLREDVADAQGGAGVLSGAAYQVVAVPYYVPVSAPRPSLWLVLGRSLDDRFAVELHQLIGADVVLLGDGAAAPLASSLAGEPRAAAAKLVATGEGVSIGQLERTEVLLAPIELPRAAGLTALLLRPSDEALLDYRQLSGRFAVVAVAALLLALAGAWVLARGVARPIRTLGEAARKVAAGDYAAELPHSRAAEISSLASDFATMQREVRAREEAIERLAFFDELTALPNRTSFQRELEEALERAGRERGQLAVAVIDLDRFRDINDALGHHAGDTLLRAAGERLGEVARQRGMIAARLGGDEFALLLTVRAVSEAEAAVAAARATLERPIAIDDLRVDVGASCGVAVFPHHGGDGATLLRRAEVAMYHAKGRRLGFAFYDSSQDPHSVERLGLAGDLHRAVEAQALELAFQPKLDLATGRVRQVEALVRWQHPRLGPISPAEFIPIAEQTGLIRKLTEWVLRAALRQCAEWHSRGISLTVAVNISALDLHDRELPARLRVLLAQAGVPAERLALEITESSVMAEPETARRLLDEVTAMGATVCVDDFGTGYSSLAQLQRLPVQELKVDKSFVIEMTRSKDLAQIVRSTIELGHNLGMRVVAEGVESGETLEVLRGMGCDMAQGFHVSAPLAAADVPAWLASLPAILGRSA